MRPVECRIRPAGRPIAPVPAARGAARSSAPRRRRDLVWLSLQLHSAAWPHPTPIPIRRPLAGGRRLACGFMRMRRTDRRGWCFARRGNRLHCRAGRGGGSRSSLKPRQASPTVGRTIGSWRHRQRASSATACPASAAPTGRSCGSSLRRPICLSSPLSQPDSAGPRGGLESLPKLPGGSRWPVRCHIRYSRPRQPRGDPRPRSGMASRTKTTFAGRCPMARSRCAFGRSLRGSS